MNKQVLRDIFLEKRLTLTADEYQKRNAALFENVQQFTLERPELRHCHLFMTITQKKEVDTRPILRWLNTSDKHLAYLPRVEGKGQLSHHLYAQNTELKISKWGIPEPVGIHNIQSTVFDLVFVPLLSYDLKGNRLGYGAGFYDRFLQQTQKKCLKVGLSISPPLDNIDYTEAHDVALDYCISHLGIHSF